MNYSVKRDIRKGAWSVVETCDWGSRKIVATFKTRDEAEDHAEYLNDMVSAMESYDFD